MGKKSTKWQHIALSVLCVVLALILAVGIIGTVYVNRLLNSMNYVDEEEESTVSSSEAEDILYNDPEVETVDPTTTETYINIEVVTPPTGVTQTVEKGEHIINILLIGQDRRPGEGRTRSDTMILMTFNTRKNTITLTSFMRDQYVSIPGYKSNKLNAAYALGGMKLLNQTMMANFGVQIDGDVEVDFSGFKNVIDFLGGVTINLSQAEADYMNERDGFSLSAGEQRLTGAQALSYTRIRYIDSDYMRAQRQRTVLMSLMSEFKNLSVTDALSMMEQILPMVTTNMTNSEIIGYATRLFPMLSGASIETLRIPVDGTFESGTIEVRPGLTAWFQYNINFEANRDLLETLFETN